MPAQDHHVEPLGKHHDRTAFSCGEAALDQYFRQQARQNVEQRIAAVFVLVETESGRVGGYYTLSSGSINLTDLPAVVARKLPRYPAVPVVLLGRLAVAREHQGRGFGAALLFDALRRALEQSAQVGAMAVVVDAKGDAARSFYERYGFHRFTDNEYRLFMPMKTIEALLQ